jgi:hypothetical protein
MKKLLLVSCVIGAMAVVAGATQETPPAASQAFEVATVKPNKSGERGGGIRRLPGGRVTVTNMAPRVLITFAYQLAQFQLVGGTGLVGQGQIRHGREARVDKRSSGRSRHRQRRAAYSRLVRHPAINRHVADGVICSLSLECDGHRVAVRRDHAPRRSVYHSGVREG